MLLISFVLAVLLIFVAVFTGGVGFLLVPLLRRDE